MDKVGNLIYKCRLCHQEVKQTSAPLIHYALICLAFGHPLPKEWFGAPAHMMDLHTCKDGRIGVCDLVGGEEINDDRPILVATQKSDTREPMAAKQGNPSLSDSITARRLALEALQTDGAHHKQWYLVKILEALHMDKEDIQREMDVSFDEWRVAP